MKITELIRPKYKYLEVTDMTPGKVYGLSELELCLKINFIFKYYGNPFDEKRQTLIF